MLTSADGSPFVVEVEDVPGPLVVDLEYWPQRLHLPLPLVRVRLRLLHLLLQLLQGGLDQLPSLGRALAAGGSVAQDANFGHGQEITGRRSRDLGDSQARGRPISR